MGSLDKYQQRVCDTLLRDGGHVRVDASAGSGKTYTVVMSSAALIESGISPGSIVATTFTRKARESFESKMASAVGSSTARSMRLGTFHSLALRDLRRSSPFAGEWYNSWDMSECIDLDGRKRHHLWRSIVDFDKGGVPGTSKPSLKLKMGNHEPKDWFGQIGVIRSRGIELGSEAAQYAAEDVDLERLFDVWELYEEAKRSLGLWDFADSLAAWKKGLLAGEYTSDARFVFVDEAQDNSRIQLEIAFLLARKGRLILIGDGCQSIYGWRGAAPEIFAQADRQLEAESLSMPYNYRSGIAIVAAGNNVAAGASWNIGEPAIAVRKEYGSVLTWTELSPESEADRIAREIRTTIDKNGRTPGDFAVLVRTNAAAGFIEGALMRQRIPAVRAGGLSFWESARAMDFLAYVKVSSGDDLAALERIYNRPKRYLGAVFIGRLRSTISKGGHDLVSAIQDVVDTSSANSSMRHNAWDLLSVLRMLRATPWDDRPDRIAELFTGGEAIMSAGDEDRQAVFENCAAIANMFSGPEEMIEYTAACARNSSLKGGSGCVTISTVHKAKGLEWPVVYVSANKGSFPHRLADEEEERRLFYVAITRAEDALIVTSARVTAKNKPAGPSPFTKKYIRQTYSHLS